MLDGSEGAMTDVQDKPEWLRGVLSAIPETGGQLVEGAGYRAEWPDDASSNFRCRTRS